MIHPLPLEEGVLCIDNSFLEWLTTCPRGCEYNRILKRTSKGSKPSLDFGTAIHSALEHRYKAFGTQPVIETDCYEQQGKILEKFFEENPPPEDDYRNLNWALEVVRHYNTRYNIEPFNLLTDDEGKPLVELSFALPLFDYEHPTAGLVPVYYTGRIDLPIVQDGRIYVMDHKTTSLMGQTFFDDLRVSPQQVGYAWAFEQLTQKKVNGFLINAIRSKQAPMKPKGGLDAWWEENFQRQREYLYPHSFPEWHYNTIALVEEFMWHHARGYFPQKKKWCVGKYGHCQYYQVCDTPPENRGVMLSAPNLYMENVWSPLKKPTT